MQIRDIILALEKLAPREYAESYDNVGLLVGDETCECCGILLALDLTLEVIMEAKARGCNLIITHHPILFRPLKRLDYQDYQSRLLRILLQNELHFYAMHTNWDQVADGVNYGIATLLGLRDLQFLLPISAGRGHGMWGVLPEPMQVQGFLRNVKKVFACKVLRHSELSYSEVQRVGVCGGAGSFLIEQAYACGVEILLTADLKYHDFFLPKSSLIVCDIGHYESEQFAMRGVFEYLQGNFHNFALFESEVNTNPVHYFTH